MGEGGKAKAGRKLVGKGNQSTTCFTLVLGIGYQVLQSSSRYRIQ